MTIDPSLRLVPDSAPAGIDPAAGLTLGPATRLMWRTPEEIQLELGDTSMRVHGLTPELVRAIVRRERPPMTQPPAGPAPGPGYPVLRALGEAGFLWPRPDEPGELLHPPVPRLAGELAALAVRHGPAATAVLDARRFTQVEVQGESRTAVHLAAVLAAAGVGHVHCTSSGITRLDQTSPGGLRPEDEGQPRCAAAERAVRSAAPESDASPCIDHHRPDLTILAVDRPIPNERRDALHASGSPHLVVTMGVDHGVVGPLVLPGLTSCLRCADLHRTDRDPAWAALAVQLSTPGRYGSPSSVAVATIIAGVAAAQALSFLDGDEPATLDGTLELRLPDWRLRRRSWVGHPDCDCCAATDQAATDQTATDQAAPDQTAPDQTATDRDQ